MKLTVNNETFEVAAEPPRPLLWILRDELGLTGTKYGCGIGYCGSCTVHLDGAPARACVTFSNTLADEISITTIEGLSTELPDGTLQLHPVQEAFLEWQAPQCSWCMSGQMMTASALLAENPTPSSDEIVEAMSGNYCRCGCYFRVKNAVQRAAEIQLERAA